MIYGAILKACRTRAGLSQEDLAHKLNINQTNLCMRTARRNQTPYILNPGDIVEFDHTEKDIRINGNQGRICKILDLLFLV